jgi:signal peptidase I
MKRAYVAQNSVDAQLVADELQAAGIDAVVKVDTLAAPSIPFPSVWVEDKDLPRALTVLEGRAYPAEGAGVPSHRRRPWIAVVLSLVLPGLGHFYAGRPGAAALRYLLAGAAAVASLMLVASLPLGAWSFPLAVAVGLATYAWIALDARRVAVTASPDYRLRSYNRWYVYVALIVGCALAGDVVRSSFSPAGLRPYRISSGAMEPTLLIGDWIFVLEGPQAATNLGHGAIVVFEAVDEPGLEEIKRVVGLPGDTVAMRDNVLYRNGVTVSAPYVRTGSGPDRTDPKMGAWQTAHLVSRDATGYHPTIGTWGPLLVPPDSVFVLGDNRDRSYDSRYYGFVAVRRIRGRPSHVYYSFDRGGPLPLPFLTAVRWHRLSLRFDH